jgi:hypothetical protein
MVSRDEDETIMNNSDGGVGETMIIYIIYHIRISGGRRGGQ